jgi:hypothetical protein
MKPEDITKSDSDIKSVVVSYLGEGKVDDALALFDDRRAEVEQAFKEYNPKLHSILSRPDKVRKNKSDYKTNKLPRNWQSYINEIELYFLMNNGVVWELLNEYSEQEKLQDVFEKFQNKLSEWHYDTYTREAKRLAGAETECAKLYAHYKDEGVDKIKIVMLSYSKGYRLRPLFNRYGDLKAFAVGFHIKLHTGERQECWDIYTSEKVYKCKRSVDVKEPTHWIIKEEYNFIGKIPVIYYRQDKAWAGVEERIERDEWLDSKNADCNEYFADPMLKISANVKNGLMDPKSAGKVIQVKSKEDVFEYVTPPDASDMKDQEKKVLKESILMGTLTPDLSYENVKGLGAISGEAITKANILGYIKRLKNMEVYNELFQRDASLIKAIMANVIYPELRKQIMKMKLHHIYQDPANGISDNSEEIARWAEIGMSDEAIVESNRNITNKRLEFERLKRKRAEQEQNQQLRTSNTKREDE